MSVTIAKRAKQQNVDRTESINAPSSAAESQNASSRSHSLLVERDEFELIPHQSRCVTKYEYTRLMCARVKHLARNAAPTLQLVTEQRSLLDIAQLEFDSGVLPFKLARRLPSGGEVVCSSSDLYCLSASTYTTTDEDVKISISK